jgi:glycosyltransferase involved in cell wall biosynthesis
LGHVATVLIFHGYLLRGTGSNVYNASLARAFVRGEHEVHLLCQERRAGELDFVDAVGTFHGDRLEVEVLREPVRCTAYLPDIHGVLPVYVADRYEDFDAVPFAELDDPGLERYLEANVVAVEAVAARAEPEAALANHLVMGPVILARGLAGRTPYAVKVHGSALEYTVRPQPERFLPYALEGLRGAAGVLVGSRHTAESLWEVTGEPGLPDRTRLGPPGVDVEAFRPRPPAEAAERLTRLAERLERAGTAAWGGERDAPRALRALDPRSARIVAFVGKLIVSKGVDLLLAAWPLVLAAVPEARLVIVGFGEYRDGLVRLAGALARGDLADAREVAARGRELEGGPPGELTYLAAFLDGLAERRERYLRAAAGLSERVHFTGRLEHGDLPDLLPACEALVMPSTFPEAFGMVAAEGAACGALPLSAGHSGMAEVTTTLAPALEERLRPLLSFAVGPGGVEEIADKLVTWLRLEPSERARARSSLAELARGRYGWESVADGVLKAALGRLDELPEPASVASASGPGSG